MNPTATSRPLRALWLVIPPIVLCLLDGGLTLFGQSDAYWTDNYSDVNELSPSFAVYLAIHPLMAAGALLLWISIFSVVIVLLPEFLALTVSITIVIAHMNCATTWLLYRFNGYQACNALFFMTAFVVVLAFKRGQCHDGSSVFDWQRTGLPEWMRWVSVSILIILPIWWFLVPH